MSATQARLAVCVQGRGPDYIGAPTGKRPTLEALQAAVSRSSAELHWLSGAEPTLRPDLPKLIHALSEQGQVGLDTDGLALVSAPVVQGLMRAGLNRIRIGLHSSHSDAHDWLVGMPGAARRARRALRTALEAGLQVHGQIILSRPTTEHLPETVALLRRLGVTSIHVRRPCLEPALGERAVSLSPRLGLLEPWLEAAVQEAAGQTLLLHDLPPCAAPSVPLGHFQLEPWILCEGLSIQTKTVIAGCSTCPQNEHCAGEPTDYVDHFGRAELDSAGPLPRDAIRVPVDPIEAVTPPPPRAGRAPATRLRQVHRQLRLGRLFGDPMNGQDAPLPPEQVTVRLVGTSRQIRRALVVAAQQGAPELIIESSGDTPHPFLAELLTDSGRLSFERVVLRAPETHIEELGDQKRVALRRVTRIEHLE